MLRKLFKHDMKEISRWGLILTIAVIVTSIIGSLALYSVSNALSDRVGNEYIASIIDLVSVFTLVISFISLVAYMIGVLFVILRRYYTNFFTDEGYLTFTLPCKKSSLILSKFFSGLLWEIIASAVLIVCIIIIMLGANIDYDWNRIYNTLLQYGNILDDYSVVLFIVEYFVLIAVTAMTSLLTMFLAISIGATVAKKHKIMASIGFYYIINWLLGIVSGISSLVPSISMSLNMENAATYDEVISIMNSSFGMTNIVFAVQIVLYVIVGVAFFFINRSILKNKLNLA